MIGALVAAVVAVAGLPSAWQFHGWSGYKPDPRAEVVESDEGPVVHLSEIAGDRGTQILVRKPRPAAAGETVTIFVEAKGTGSVSACVRHYSARDAWNPPEGESTDSVKLGADWKSYRFDFTVRDGKEKTAFIRPAVGASKGGEVWLRHFRVGQSRPPQPPEGFAPTETFDPVRSGWPCVFEDEFEGPAGASFDTNRWVIAGDRNRPDFVRLDGEGHLRIKCDFHPGTNLLESTTLWSREAWKFGYFEARLKFTRNNGWWSSFWLYSRVNHNPFEDGAEIDVYEDPGTREPGGANPAKLSNTLHMYHQGTLKSFSFNSYAEGGTEVFHTIGCKWTPLEISIYLDGRLRGTFDAFRHGAVAAPLHALLSGCIMRGWGNRDTKGFTFPEYFTVDSVRVYAWPKEGPAVAWKGDTALRVVGEGEKQVFEADIPDARPIQAAYLFDTGYPVAVRTEKPWRFEVPFSRKDYLLSRYSAVGSQHVAPDFVRTLHSFSVIAVDTEGKIGLTDRPQRRLLDAGLVGRRGPKSVQRIPGAVMFDEKPSGVADRLASGNVIVCEADVAESGTYEATLNYASAHDDIHRLIVTVDGREVSDVHCPPGTRYTMHDAEPVRLKLTAGRHRFVFVPIGFVFAGPMNFRKID